MRDLDVRERISDLRRSWRLVYEAIAGFGVSQELAPRLRAMPAFAALGGPGETIGETAYTRRMADLIAKIRKWLRLGKKPDATKHDTGTP